MSKTPAKKIKTELAIKQEVKSIGRRISESGDGNKFYQCSECPYSTGHENRAKVHSNMHALIEKGFKTVLQCPSQCGYLTLEQKRMKEHLISHKTERDQECPFCDAKTKSERSLGRHIKTLHSEKVKKG